MGYDRGVVSIPSLFFFLSGAAALIYEIIWLKLLAQVFGNTTHAVSTVLSAYMAGLGFGSYGIGKAIDRQKRSLRVYGLLELGIGVYAAATFWILQALDFLYVRFAQSFDPGLAALTLIRFVFSFMIVFIPAYLMGGTFPVLAKFFAQRRHDVSSQVALLYGLNTLGAVVGTLSAGFLLLPLLGLRLTLGLAVALNVAIGVLALRLSRRLEQASGAEQAAPQEVGQPVSSGRRFLVAGLFFSGATAMMYEVGWTRILSAVLGSSTYAFTTMLATFLLGIALGSMLCRPFLKNRQPRWIHWSLLQILISLSALAALPLFAWVPLAVVRSFAMTADHYALFQAMLFVICDVLMMAPAIGFGALFPVSASLQAQTDARIGGKIGSLYLANTFGNIVGSIAAGFFFIPLFGIHKTLILAIVVGAFLAICAALIEKSALLRMRLLCLAPALVILVFSGVEGGRGWNARLLTGGLQCYPQLYARTDTVKILDTLFQNKIFFYKEGLNSLVSVSQVYDNLYLKVNGKTDASTSEDMKTQLMLGHLPHLLHPNPQNTLIIGLGSGTTLAASLVYPVQKVDCVELEPAVVEAAPYFERINRGSYGHPKARILINDGRNHLKVTPDKYDIIISEPSNPWIAGVASLFSVEFYRLAEKRLNDDGILCQWLQQYCTSLDDFKMVLASVRSVFPYASLWRATSGDTLIIAGKKPLQFNWGQIEKKWNAFPQIQKDLSPYEISGPGGLLPHFLLGEKDLSRWIQGTPANTDDRLLLEYTAPANAYKDFRNEIQTALQAHRTESWPPLTHLGGELHDNAERLFQISQGFFAMNDLLKAKECFRTLLLKFPGHENAAAELGRCYLAEGKYSEALSQLTPLRSAEAYRYLALALFKLDKKQLALEAAEKSVARDSKDWKNFSMLGDILVGQGRWTDAAAVYQKQSQLKPESLDVKLHYVAAQINANNPREALKMIKKLKEQYPTCPAVYTESKRAHELLGDTRSIIADFEKFAAWNPYNLYCWQNLADLYNRTGDAQKFQFASRQVKKLS